MERCLTEEQVTKAILDWLESNGWEIICFDFPQSGTGVILHPNKISYPSKNKGAFIPDIVAIKDNIVLFFEDKDRFYLDDLQKVCYLRTTDKYSSSIRNLLSNYQYTSIHYGVGVAYSEKAVEKIDTYSSLVDFAVFCKPNKEILVYYDKRQLFS